MPKIVLTVESQPLLERLNNTLKQLNIPIAVAQNLQQVLTLLDSDEFLILFVEQDFPKKESDEGKLMNYLSKLPMYKRREFMVVLIGDNLQSGNRFTAYALNADLVVNSSDLESVTALFKRAYSEYQSKFKLFRELLKNQASLS